MVNTYSARLGLGQKVRAQDFIDASAVAVARDHAEMLEALKACAEQLDRETLGGEALDRARYLIARATNQEPTP